MTAAVRFFGCCDLGITLCGRGCAGRRRVRKVDGYGVARARVLMQLRAGQGTLFRFGVGLGDGRCSLRGVRAAAVDRLSLGRGHRLGAGCFRAWDCSLGLQCLHLGRDKLLPVAFVLVPLGLDGLLRFKAPYLLGVRHGRPHR